MRAVFGIVLIAGLGLAGFAVYMVQGFFSEQETALARERAKELCPKVGDGPDGRHIMALLTRRNSH